MRPQNHVYTGQEFDLLRTSAGDDQITICYGNTGLVNSNTFFQAIVDKDSTE